MDELLESMAQLDASNDPGWSADVFSRLLSLAIVASDRIGPNSLSSTNWSDPLPVYGSAGARLLFELRKALESSRSIDMAWQAAGTLMCWALDVHARGRESLRAELARRAREERGFLRHAEALPEGGDDVVFETHLNQVLEKMATIMTMGRAVNPPHLDDFFAKGILMPLTKDDIVRRAAGIPPLPSTNPLFNLSQPKRLALIVESALERFLVSLHSSTNPATKWIAHDFTRLVTSKAGKMSIPAMTRAVLSQLLSKQAEGMNSPKISDNARLLSFLLGNLDIDMLGDVESEVADDLLLGEYNVVTFVGERLASSPEEMDEDFLAQRVFTIIKRKWPVVFQPSRMEAAMSVLVGIASLLQKKLDSKQRVDALCMGSLAQASIVTHSVFTSGQRDEHSDNETRQDLIDLNFRLSTLLALSSEAPSEHFSIALAAKTYGEESIRMVALAIGCSVLDPNTELMTCRTLVDLLDRDAQGTSWIVGQVALEAPEWTTNALGLWHYDCGLAGLRLSNRIIAECARELREGKRSSLQSSTMLDELDRLEALFLGLHGLESKGSIRHLQDAASFYVHFGKRLGFGQAGEKFLEDCARALSDFKRHWESGNCRIMLATCHLARKEWSAASIEYRGAAESFELCGALAEADAVRTSCRAFMAMADKGREWDWCVTPLSSDEEKTATAHYFLVGAVGIGDPDLTVIRSVALSPRGAFDDAIAILEHGSLRRRMHGELRWAAEGGSHMVAPHFFPAQSTQMEEFGFWIQRIWPLIGEETAEHIPRRFGIAGEPHLLIEVNTRRGLNALISAASVAVRLDSSSSSNGRALDVPFGWTDEQDMPPRPPNYPPALEQLNIPLPPGPPPPPEQEEEFASSSSSSKRTMSMRQEAPPIRREAPPTVNVQQQAQPPPVEQEEVETEAQRRKREFLAKKKRQQEEVPPPPPSPPPSQPPSTSPPPEEEEEEKDESSFLLLHRRKGASPPSKSEPSYREPVESNDISMSQRNRDEDEWDDMPVPQQSRSQRDLSEGVSGTPRIALEEVKAAARTTQRRIPQNQSDVMKAANRNQQRRVQLVNDDGDDLEEVIGNKSALPSRNITLVDRPSRSNRRIILEDDDSDMPRDRRARDESRPRAAMDESLPPHSTSRAFFNVGGARVTVEEATLTNKYLSSGEGWISALLLSSPKQTPVSVKFSSESGEIQVFAEPAFDLMETIRISSGISLDPLPSDPNILELFDPERLANGKGPLLFSCDHPDLFRALVGSFRDSKADSGVL